MTDTERILQHYKEPYHQHKPPKPDDFYFFNIGRAENPLCDDWIRCWVRVTTGEPKIIHGVWWEGHGCCFSQAAASMVAKHFEGKTLVEGRAFTQDDMLELFQFNIEPDRIECVMVSLNAAHDALEDIPV